MPETDRDSTPITYLAVLAGAVCCYAALGAVLEILPRYVPDRLGGGPASVGLAVGAPALPALLARPLGGRAADRLGPLMPLLAGASLMAIGALPAALSSTWMALLLSRLCVGFGEGAMMSASVLWLLQLCPADRRGRALGHIGLANYGGLTLGPLLAGALGGARASGTIFWSAAVLPLLAAGIAFAAGRVGPSRTRDQGGSGRQRNAPLQRTSTRMLLRLTGPAGAGLLLVNVGYVAVLSLGGARARTSGLDALVVPIFAGVIVLARTLGGTLPDRLGGLRTAVVFAAAEAAGLLLFANAGARPVQIGALVAVAIGQALAVPGLGLLALSRIPRGDQGAAAGLFFAWFDAGVGIGGPSVGAVAGFAGAAGGLDLAAAAVTAAMLIAGFAARDQRVVAVSTVR